MLPKLIFVWWKKLIVFIFVLLLVNSMTWLMTSQNQKAGLYSLNTDSIGIPIMFTIGISILLLPLIVVISLSSKKDSLVGLKMKSIRQNLLIKITLLLLYTPILLFALYGIIYWCVPGHYLIAGSYLILCAVFSVGLIFDWIGEIRSKANT